MSKLSISTYELMSLGIHKKLSEYCSKKGNKNIDGWWDIADIIFSEYNKFKIVFTYYSEFETFEEYPPTENIIKKYTEDIDGKENTTLIFEEFLFESEQDKLAFILKWS